MKFEKTTERTVIAALIGLIVGGLLIVGGTYVQLRWVSILLLNCGSFVIASVVMALIFEFWQLRALLDDLFRQVRRNEQLQRAQLSGFSVSFHDNLPWDELFSESSRLDVFVTYAATWRNAQRSKLEKFVSHADAALEVILPDPDNKTIIGELAARFGMNPEDLAKRIKDATDDFISLARSAKGSVKVYYCQRAPHFSFYRFNNRVVYASYRHQPGRGAILTLVGNRGGELYEWVRAEWYGVKDAADLTRQVFPVVPAPGDAQ